MSNMKHFGKIAVIGMGYVGIPSSMVFANYSTVSVLGFQRKGRSDSKIEMLNAGKNPLIMNEPVLDKEIELAVSNGKFECTSDFKRLSECDAALIDVQTPFLYDETVNGIQKYTKPDYSHMYEAIENVMLYMTDPLIVIESTVSPGTTDSLMKYIEDKTGWLCGVDFTLAHAPERVTPGKCVYNLLNIDRCIGGVDTVSTNNAMLLYGMISKYGKNISMTALEAEITKTAENAIRDVQIAIANQLALYCESLGANFFKVKEGIDSLRGEGITRSLLYPGSGVGGHCLVKDPYHLEYGIDRNFEHTGSKLPYWIPSLFIIARRINNYMPHHVVTLLEESFSEKSLKNVLVLGYAAIKNTGDTRNSPTELFMYLMNNLHPEVEVTVYDPYVSQFKNKEWSNKFDAVVIMIDHDIFRDITPFEMKQITNRCPVIIDTRNIMNGQSFMSMGFIYKGIGRGDLN